MTSNSFIKIELDETFDADNAVLMPGSKDTNAINKDVSVKNVGSNDAWVRVIISVPSALDVLTVKPENYEEIAAQNILHWNIVAGIDEIWNVEKACWEAKLSADQAYNEYTFYYNKPLEAGDTTEQLLDQVYLDAKVDCDIAEDGSYVWTKGDQVINYQLEKGASILVKAEAIQADGFETYAEAFAAFDAQ